MEPGPELAATFEGQNERFAAAHWDLVLIPTGIRELATIDVDDVLIETSGARRAREGLLLPDRYRDPVGCATRRSSVRRPPRPLTQIP